VGLGGLTRPLWKPLSFPQAPPWERENARDLWPVLLSQPLDKMTGYVMESALFPLCSPSHSQGLVTGRSPPPQIEHQKAGRGIALLLPATALLRQGLFLPLPTPLALFSLPGSEAEERAITEAFSARGGWGPRFATAASTRRESTATRNSQSVSDGLARSRLVGPPRRVTGARPVSRTPHEGMRIIVGHGASTADSSNAHHSIGTGRCAVRTRRSRKGQWLRAPGHRPSCSFALTE